MTYDQRQPAAAPRVALLGCGSWGRNFVRVLRELDVLEVVADPSTAALEDACRLAPGVRTEREFGAVLADPRVQAVVVATPAETHFSVGLAALEAGRDALIEKPLTTEAASAKRLVRRAEELGRTLMVGHLLEHHPAIARLLQLVRDGELGKLFYAISNRLNLGKIRREENALWSFAPHDIAVILRLVGSMPWQVVATGGNYIQPNIADVTVTQLLFDNGVRAHTFVSWLHPFKEQRLVVIGSDRMASYDDVSKSLVLYDQRVNWHRGEPVPVRGSGVPVSFDPEEPLRAECLHFLESIRTGTTPLTDGPSGVRVLQVLEAAQRSLLTNGDPVSLHALNGDLR